MVVKYPYQEFKQAIERKDQIVTLGWETRDAVRPGDRCGELPGRHSTVLVAPDGMSVQPNHVLCVYVSGPNDFSIPWSAVAKMGTGFGTVYLETKDYKTVEVPRSLFDRENILFVPAE